MIASEAQEVINIYTDDLFRGILTSANPNIAAKEYIRKKRLMHRFRKLLELDHLPEETKEEMISKMVAVLPTFTTTEAYIEARGKILETMSDYLMDTLRELENLIRQLNPQEIKNAQRIMQRRQKHILESMRETFAEIIVKNPKEELLILDQALALAIKLYDELLDDPENIGKSLFLLVILLRIIGLGKGVFNYKILYEDLAEITAELESEIDVPREVLDLLNS